MKINLEINSGMRQGDLYIQECLDYDNDHFAQELILLWQTFIITTKLPFVKKNYEVFLELMPKISVKLKETDFLEAFEAEKYIYLNRDYQKPLIDSEVIDMILILSESFLEHMYQWKLLSTIKYFSKETERRVSELKRKNYAINHYKRFVEDFESIEADISDKNYVAAIRHKNKFEALY